MSDVVCKDIAFTTVKFKRSAFELSSKNAIWNDLTTSIFDIIREKNVTTDTVEKASEQRNSQIKIDIKSVIIHCLDDVQMIPFEKL